MVRVWTARRKASQSEGQIYLHCQREHGVAVGSSMDTFGSNSPTVFFCLYSLDTPWKQTRNILQHERRKKKPQDSQNKVALLLKLCTNSHFLLMQNAHTNVVHCEVVVQRFNYAMFHAMPLIEALLMGQFMKCENSRGAHKGAAASMVVQCMSKPNMLN